MSSDLCPLLTWSHSLLALTLACVRPFAESWNPRCYAIAAFVGDCVAANDFDRASRSQDQHHLRFKIDNREQRRLP